MTGEVGSRWWVPQGMRWEKGKGSTDKHILKHREHVYDHSGLVDDHILELGRM